MCGLDISFVKSILHKRIVTKFFWDYCLNSRVCNYGKSVTPRPNEVHSTCNYRGTYVHQVPL